MSNVLVENKFIKIYIKEDILYGIYLCEELNFEEMYEAYKLRLKISNGKSYPGIIDGRNVKKMTKEARVFGSTKEASNLLTCCAIVINSPLGEMLGNFYITVNPPSVKTRLFRTIEQAEIWIKKQNNTL